MKMPVISKYHGAYFVVLGLIFMVYFLYNGIKQSVDHIEYTEENGGQSPWQQMNSKEQSKPKFPCSSKCSQENRLWQLREKCKKYPELKRAPNEIPRARLMVDDMHKVIYCQLSKAGSTSFNNLLYYAVTGKYQERQHCNECRRNAGIRWLDQFSEAERAQRLRDYYKILVVRHPFDRLVSCYNGKFTRPSREATWTQHGPAMIKMFRKGYVGKQQKYRTGAKWIEFTKYVNYLEDRFPEKHNHHWNKIIDECYPCSIDYDIIAKVETMEYDVAPILSRLNVTEFPSLNVRRHDDQNKESFAGSKVLGNYNRLTPKLIHSLQQMYEVDMDLFGYSFDTSTMTASCGSSNCNSPSCC